MVKKSLSIQQQTVPSCSSSNLARLLLDIVFISTTIFSFFTPPIIMSSSLILQRTFGKSTLSRQVPFDQAWNAPPWQEADNDNDNDNDTETEPSKQEPTPRFCCLIYATQNGWKLPILFEEMGVQYDWCLVDFEINQQKSAEFLKINPNGRIPALIDRHKNVTVAESGAILEYICEEAESKLLPSKEDDLQMHLTCKQWLYWQVSGQGPMMGQSMYFNRIAAIANGERDEFSIARFGKEAQRCLQIMNDQLKESGGPFLLGNEVTVVDVACFAYAASAYWACVDISGMAELNAYLTRMHERPSFKIGLTIPFARPAFFGPPWATEEEIQAEISANAAQFTASVPTAKKQKTEEK